MVSKAVRLTLWCLQGYADVCNAWTSEKTSYDKRGDPTQQTDYLQYPLGPNNTVTSLIQLFLNAPQGSASSGTFTVYSDDTVDEPLVEVSMKYRNRVARNVTNVCLMRTIDAVGLGIYVSQTALVLSLALDLVEKRLSGADLCLF